MSRSLFLSVMLLAAALGAAPAAAGEPSKPVLPPLEPWQGKSLELAATPDHAWATPFERGGMVATPPYHETVAWLEGLAAEL